MDEMIALIKLLQIEITNDLNVTVDRTVSHNWVAAVYGPGNNVLEVIANGDDERGRVRCVVFLALQILSRAHEAKNKSHTATTLMRELTAQVISNAEYHKINLSVLDNYKAKETVTGSRVNVRA